jgi:large subunit ribosomal protein L3
MKTIYGFKIGMTRIFDQAGDMVPVTVVRAEPMTVIDIRTADKNGYDALRLGFGAIRKKLVSKPMAGQYKKTAIDPGRYIREIKVSNIDDYKVDDKIGVDIFKEGEKIHITGISKGHGFQGTVKRHGFKGGPKTHGQSDRLRAPGSIGGSSYPSRVWKGQRMAGHMGNQKVTVKNLRVASIEPEHNLILIRGAVPGKPGGLLRITKAQG